MEAFVAIKNTEQLSLLYRVTNDDEKPLTENPMGWHGLRLKYILKIFGDKFTSNIPLSFNGRESTVDRMLDGRIYPSKKLMPFS